MILQQWQKNYTRNISTSGGLRRHWAEGSRPSCARKHPTHSHGCLPVGRSPFCKCSVACSCVNWIATSIRWFWCVVLCHFIWLPLWWSLFRSTNSTETRSPLHCRSYHWDSCHPSPSLIPWRCIFFLNSRRIVASLHLQSSLLPQLLLLGCPGLPPSSCRVVYFSAIRHGCTSCWLRTVLWSLHPNARAYCFPTLRASPILKGPMTALKVPGKTNSLA